jgi:UDP-N-acetylmuramate--alanine ligase
MSHTYSRTRALLPEFARCFGSADLVILHKIYASAREKNAGDVSGRHLFDAVAREHGNAAYFEEPAEAIPFLRGELRPGDLFLTMGAGDNWKLGRELYRSLGGGQ